MNLDDSTTFATLDKQDMLAHIDGLPDQLQTAWELGLSKDLPEMPGLRQVLVAGMGGTIIGADLLEAYLAPRCPLPIFISRDYDLPAWANSPETLVITISHSGNTAETLSAFSQATGRGCQRLAITTGGELAQEATRTAAPLWIFEHSGQPRAAVGYSFGLLLAACKHLDLLPDAAGVANELDEAIAAMRAQQAGWRAEVPAAQNPAKRLAGQLVGRWVAVFGSGVLAPVARRWKGQVNELAKAWAQFEILPEADHNTLAGALQPEAGLAQMIALFLVSASDHPHNRLRAELTRKSFMLEGLNTDLITAAGEGTLAHQWTTLLLGDYVAYYLAMAYGADPSAVDAIVGFKTEMAAATG